VIDVPFDTQGVLARTLWAEARSQGGEGMHAVANVILNRAAQPDWWGKDIRSVCLAPYQFSCWNENDP
jgi:spore germination cell wall hydrolase CwlJ-like protein